MHQRSTGRTTTQTPPHASTQSAHKVHRIGILGLAKAGSGASVPAWPEPRNPGVNALLRGLRELGWVYGGHFVTEQRGRLRSALLAWPPG